MCSGKLPVWAFDLVSAHGLDSALVHTCCRKALSAVVNVKLLSFQGRIFYIHFKGFMSTCLYVCMLCIHRCICVYVMKLTLPVFQILKWSWFGSLQVFVFFFPLLLFLVFSFLFFFLSKLLSQIKTLQNSWRTNTIWRP